MRYLRTMALTIFSVYALLASAHAAAKTIDVLEQQLYQLSLDSHILLVKYYHAQAEEGQRELLHDVRQRQSVLNHSWQQLIEPIQDSHPDVFEPLNTYWLLFNRYLTNNLHELENSHFPELQVVTLMRDQLYLFMRQLDQIGRHWQQRHNVSLTTQQKLLRDQQRLLLTVVERYIERAASSMGAPLTIDGEDMHSLTQRFSNGLAVIERWPMSMTEQQLLKRIRSQWHLIAKTANQTQQRLVPYLIMRYADNLIERLPQLHNSGE